MEYEEVDIGEEMYKFELNRPIEGKLEEIRTEVGKNGSTVYVVKGSENKYTFWGTTALDLLMSRLQPGDHVRITLVDENYKFPSGRTGKQFKVERAK